MRRQNHKILLFIDQHTAHLQTTDFLQNVKILFFPANSTSVAQPFDLGASKNLQMFHRQRLIQIDLQNIATEKN
ncbi:hypothetical protein X975_05596, partial [Stegodyphus mimosarum]